VHNGLRIGRYREDHCIGDRLAVLILDDDLHLCGMARPCAEQQCESGGG
jgi:hypothetical protein